MTQIRPSLSSRAGLLMPIAGIRLPLLPLGAAGCGDSDVFTLRIENVSTASTLWHEGGEAALPLAPGVFVVHAQGAPLFAADDADCGERLEALAEDGDPSTLAASLDMADSVHAVGAFAVRDGADEPAPTGSGQSYSFDVSAGGAGLARRSPTPGSPARGREIAGPSLTFQ